MKRQAAANCVGRTYGHRTVLEYIGTRQGRTQVRVRCACGKIDEVPLSDLNRGRSLSCRRCGCHTREYKRSARLACRPGDVFGRLTIVEDLGIHAGARRAKVRCVCGPVLTVLHANLRKGSTHSCGGIHSEQLTHRNTTHGEADVTSEYVSWQNMLHRCRNTNSPGYRNYGGRGIRVCARWQKDASFLADMGRKPTSEHSIERRNVNKGYSPANCVWATRAQQNNNKRNSVRITYQGITHTPRQWSDLIGIPASTIRSRRHSDETSADILRPVGAPRVGKRKRK